MLHKSQDDATLHKFTADRIPKYGFAMLIVAQQDGVSEPIRSKIKGMGLGSRVSIVRGVLCDFGFGGEGKGGHMM